MWCGWGFYFRRPFEGQAGTHALQAQNKPPAKPVVMIFLEKIHKKLFPQNNLISL